MPSAPFVHLRVRSAFSLLESTIRYDELAKRCRRDGMPAVAVTDSANLFGAMQFCAAAKKAGVQPIVGVLLALAPPESLTRQTHRPLPPEQIVLLAKDAGGYANLLQLLTQAYLGAEPGSAVQVTTADLARHAEGLICLTGGACGPLGAALRRGDAKYAMSLLAELREAFGDRLYVELQRHGLEDEETVEEGLVDLAYAQDVPLVATNDAHFMDAENHGAHDALLCIAQGAQMAEENRRRLTVEHRLKSPEEMVELFADLPEAIANTLVIARRCAFMTPGRDPILPTFAADEEAEMRRQAEEGLERRLRQVVWTESMDDAAREAAAKPYRDRLAYELDVIAQMRFPGYFLIVSDFIRWAKGQGIAVGPGRGSGAGSVVAWSLEITDLDPLRFGLLFERFLNPERVSMPDFDIDFCEERRDEVIRYVATRYGADRVAQIITFGTLQARAALRDVGRVMGLPFGLVDRVCKLVPHNPANPVTLPQALELEPRIKETMAQDESVARMVDIAMKLEGLPRHASTHAAGVVIGDRRLDALVPLYRDPRALMPATQFNMKDVEKAGLVKFDFLGLSTLTMLRLAERLVRESGVDFELDTLPLDDKRTYDLLSRAETQGVFQLESAGMRDALRRLKPDCFEDIIAMVSLYRPGPMDNIPRYTNVKHGIEKPEYLHPLLEPILAETNGVIIYQEQVMEIAKQLAGYSLGGADLLRRAMGKKIKAEMDAQRETFIDGAQANGIGADLATTIFDAVAKFASYGFNKSHAAAYALLAYQTAYLKANHAVQFYAAAMTTEIENQEKLAAFRQEMRVRGVPLFPPDVNHSGATFCVERDRPDPGVRYALGAIKGVGRAAMDQLVAEREGQGPFRDAFDLSARLSGRVLNRRLLESLIKAGALDSLETNRRRLHDAADLILRHGAAAAAEAESAQESLFGGAAPVAVPVPVLPAQEDWPALERLQMEFDVLGLYLSAHPLDGYLPALQRLGVTMADEARGRAASGEGGRLKLAGVVVAKQERVTEKTRFARVIISDPTAQIEVTVFAELLSQTREVLEGHGPLYIEADARIDEDNLRLTAQRVARLDEVADVGGRAVEIRLASSQAAPRLRPLLEKRNGARVRLVFASPQGEDVVLVLPEGYALTSGQRLDIERLPGVVAVREVATLH
ncbi:MAG: DNA polymerase III subunit alpha [Geminicoccaceae bacterium]